MSTSSADSFRLPVADSELSSQIQDRSIGEIICKAKGLSAEHVSQIVRYQHEHGLRFGEAALALGLVQREDVIWALSQQFQYPYASQTSTQNLHEDLVMAHSPFSDEVECFRDLRSQLMMGVLAPAQGRRALSIISPDVGDGKTFIAANLAVAFSQLRGRTLIVDADMRNPRLHEVFNIENNIGLSSILSGRTQGNVIRQIAELPNLYFLPVGAVPPNPSELVQQAGFDLLIQELMNKFDNVLVDTPAASHGSDARMIAAKCGAALIVSRKDKTHSATLQKLMSQLAKGPTLVAGVMFNVY